MAMLILAAVLPILLGFGGVVSGGGVRSSSELSIGLIAQGNAAAFRGYTMALGDYTVAFGGLGAIS
jgi:hypothetical protein